LDTVVEFKRKVYKQALTELSRLLKTNPCQSSGYETNDFIMEKKEIVLASRLEVSE
jgi:putative (di)nucleoside polyphosphate hydrolase